MVENKMKIKIRKAKPLDAEGISKIFEEGLKRNNFLYTGRNSKFEKEVIEKMKKEYGKKNPDLYCFLAIDEDSKKIVGSITAFFKKRGRLRHRAELAWGIHPDYQGMGIGTNLLKEISKFLKKKGFKRIEAEAAVENVASWKLAHKAGFTIEGVRKSGLLKDNGKYADTYIMEKILK